MPAKADARRFDDLFAEFGPITARRFFGGEGLCAGDIMFGMVFDDCIYFKTDAESRRGFLADKCKPFSFKKHSTGETVVTTWYALPERLYDDPDELAAWARTACAVAQRAAAVKRKQRRAIDQKPRRRRK